MSSRTGTQIKLSPLTLQAIRRKAKLIGQSPAEFVESLVARDALSEKSLGDLLSPLRAGVESAGLTPEDFDKLIDRARRRVPPKKRRR